MLDAYANAEHRESRIAILSLIAPHFSIKTTVDLFLCDRNKVQAAKVHAAEGNAGVQLERLKRERFRTDPQKIASLHHWARSDYGTTEGDAGSDDLQLRDIKARLYESYKVHAREALPHLPPVSQSNFYQELGEGFVDQTSENCCCGQCIEGWQHLHLLEDFIPDTSITIKERASKA
jgi:hypothetical protein